MGKLFGTDGIRGKANIYPMTSEVALQVGRAAAYVLTQRLKIGRKKARILIGKDTRLSCYMIEQALSSGINSLGADSLLVGPMPTPAIAFLTGDMRADAAFVISASHNPYYDNGIKIFAGDGFKLDDDTEREIENLIFSGDLDKLRPTEDMVGKAFRIDDAMGRYIVFLKSILPKDMRFDGFRVILDCANGATYKVAPAVFEELGAEVIKRGIEPNGLNINKKVGSMYPENVSSATTEYRADIGISLDGDGDRVVLSDEKGNIINGDTIMGICALEMKKSGQLEKDTLVTTPMSNIGLEISMKENGIGMTRVNVGDRYIVEEMKKNNLTLGGEQSGHIVFMKHSTTGDGIIAALKVLEIMKSTGKKLSDLASQIKCFPQVIKNVRVSKKVPFNDIDEIQKSITEAQLKLGSRGRVFVRYSGTEPLARVMVEGENHGDIQLISSNIVDLINKNLG